MSVTFQGHSANMYLFVTITQDAKKIIKFTQAELKKYVSSKHSKQRLSDTEILTLGFSKFNYI
jgi:hypothetical protein